MQFCSETGVLQLQWNYRFASFISDCMCKRCRCILTVLELSLLDATLQVFVTSVSVLMMEFHVCKLRLSVEIHVVCESGIS